MMASKTGMDDFLAQLGADGAFDALVALSTDRLRPPPADEYADDQEGGSQADRLVRLGSAGELFCDALGDPYARVKVQDHLECWPIASRGFRLWLLGAYYAATRSAPSGDAIKSALDVLAAKARFEGVAGTAHVRVAPDGAGGVFIDLGDTEWRAVHVTGNGWEIVADPPVNFRRSNGAAALPDPVPGGDLDELRAFINVKDDQSWVLVKAWLRACFRERGPYPVLPLRGEQGSAKTTTARMLRALVDPASPDLRSDPREIRDLAIAARACWVVAFDNVSHVQPWLSDALCRLATGGGFSTRMMYSDFDEALFHASRPVLLTGITDYVARDDLADRAVSVMLAPIPDFQRRDEKRLWADFEAARPRLLGALLDDIAAAIRTLPSVKLSRLPRMADFALWAVAAEKGRGEPPVFLRAYAGAREEAHDQAIEASPIGGPLRRFLEADLLNGPWEGNSSDLKARLEKLGGDRAVRTKDWPSNSRAMSGELRKLAPAIRALGYTLDFDGGKRRRHRIARAHHNDAEEMAATPSGPCRPLPKSPLPDRNGATDGAAVGAAVRGGPVANRHGPEPDGGGRPGGPTRYEGGPGGVAPLLSGEGVRARDPITIPAPWRCLRCRALEGHATGDGQWRCSGCGDLSTVTNVATDQLPTNDEGGNQNDE